VGWELEEEERGRMNENIYILSNYLIKMISVNIITL
jgi:hypothetical protein